VNDGGAPPANPAGGVRADVWLWAARWFKTRSLAKAAVLAGQVRINDEPIKVARAVRIGDRLTVTRAHERHDIDVLGLSDTRGSAPIAQALYRETEASVAARERQREQRRADQATTIRPPTKPDKKSRRQLSGLLEHFWPK
jgi:ribosome-associated heat shock protein Hsp15